MVSDLDYGSDAKLVYAGIRTIIKVRVHFLEKNSAHATTNERTDIIVCVIHKKRDARM